MYNSHISLVHYPEQIEAHNHRYDSDVTKKMFKTEHYKKVGTFFRLTTNLHVNDKTESSYFLLQDATDV